MNSYVPLRKTGCTTQNRRAVVEAESRAKGSCSGAKCSVMHGEKVLEICAQQSEQRSCTARFKMVNMSEPELQGLVLSYRVGSGN